MYSPDRTTLHYSRAARSRIDGPRTEGYDHALMAQAETISEDDKPPPAVPMTIAGPSEAEAGGILTVDLAAIAANWRTLAHRALPAECAAVVKADGYGCGIEQVAAVLSNAGCRTFFVADLAEAARLRSVTPDAIIYVLNGLLPGSGPAFADIHARPVIGSLLELAEWDAFIDTHQWQSGAALHVDTGMNRLGVSTAEAVALANRLRAENHGISLLMSHLACAQQAEHPLNERQRETFRQVRQLYRGITTSLANSSGILLGEGYHCDLVRPGAALYGVNPTPGKRNPMRPVVTLQARIAQLRHVPRGETVGYDATWTARRASRIAVLAVGYADGYPRAASSSDSTPGADVIIAGRRCPVAGRISMDLMAVDVSALPEGTVKRGDLATLIGEEITVDEVAANSGTIGYEILTRLGHRYRRVYRPE